MKRDIYFKYTGTSRGGQGQKHSWASEGSGNHKEPVASPRSSLHVCIVADHLHPLSTLHGEWKVLRTPGFTVTGPASHTDWTGSPFVLIHTDQLGHFGSYLQCLQRLWLMQWGQVSSAVESALTRRWSHTIWTQLPGTFPLHRGR